MMVVAALGGGRRRGRGERGRGVEGLLTVIAPNGPSTSVNLTTMASLCPMLQLPHLV